MKDISAISIMLFSGLLTSMIMAFSGPTRSQDVVPPIGPISKMNLFLPDDSRGGYGDLMSNIWMGQRLKVLHPGQEISIYIHGSFKEKFERLFPEATGKAEHTDESGIKFVVIPSGEEAASIRGNFNTGICNMTFSFNHFTEPYDQRNKALETVEDGSVLSFDQYGYPLGSFTGQRMANVVHPSKDMIAYIDEHNKIDTAKFKSAFTTGLASSGLYIDSVKPAVTSELKDIKNQFTRKAELDGETVYGLSYTDQPESAQAYLQAAAKYATQNPTKKVAIVVIDKLASIALPDPMPDNLIVEKKAGLSFKEMDKVFEQTTFPIMVTGDMSNTQALQYEKVFFSEELEHQRNHLHALNEALEDMVRVIPPTKSSGGVSGANSQKEYLKAALAKKYPGDTSSESILKAKYFKDMAEEMFAVMNSASKQEKFVKSIQDVRRHASLPKKILAMCEEAKKEAPDFEKFSYDSLLKEETSKQICALKESLEPVIGIEKIDGILAEIRKYLTP